MANSVGESEKVSEYGCEFVENPPEEFESECQICLQILCEPYLVSCCGYSYCKTCIQKIQNSVLNKACPMCKKEGFTIFPNKGLERSLKKLQVRCSYEQRGCKWTGPLGELVNHLNRNPQTEKQQLNGCGFTKVNCVHCNNTFERSAIKKHQNDECDKRPFRCQFCSRYKTHYYDVVNKHWPLCDFKPEPCPNKCGKSPQKQNVVTHVENDCPLTKIQCVFHYAGCQEYLPRENMPGHLTERTVNHLSLFGAHQKKIEDRHEQQLNELKRENEVLKQRLADVQQTIQGTETRLRNEILATAKAIRKDLKSSDDTRTEDLKTVEEKLRNEMRTTDQGLKNELKAAKESLMKQTKDGIDAVNKELGATTQVLRNEITATTGKLMRELTTAMENAKKELKGAEENLGRGIRESAETFKKDIRDAEQKQQACVTLAQDKLQNEMKVADEKLLTEQKRVEDENYQRVLALQAKQKSVSPYVGMHPLHYVELEITKYATHKRNGDEWFSLPFYSRLHGHKLCLSVTVQSCGKLSMYVYLMKGEFDNTLEKIHGKITIRLCVANKQLQALEAQCSISLGPFSRYITNEIVWDGPLSQKYVQNDCLRFQVVRID